MSTEEAELTFIRCPSCRSLVPAVASRCRMCGYSFAEAKKEASATVGRPTETIEKPVASSAAPTPEPEKNIHISSLSDVYPPTNEEDDLEVISDFEDDTDDGEEDSFGQTSEITNERLQGLDEAGEPAVRRKRRRRRKRKTNLHESVENPVAFQEIERNKEDRPVPNANGSSRQLPHETGSRIESPRVTREGSLVGWFVSFGGDPKGVSFEIRSGQFFIGKERLRENDVLIRDASVSTPHLLIRVSNDGAVQVQDLLSESGTYICRAGETAFSRCVDSVILRHGDTIKIGSYEMLVCLLPSR